MILAFTLVTILSQNQLYVSTDYCTRIKTERTELELVTGSKKTVDYAWRRVLVNADGSNARASDSVSFARIVLVNGRATVPRRLALKPEEQAALRKDGFEMQEELLVSLGGDKAATLTLPGSLWLTAKCVRVVASPDDSSLRG